MGFLEPTPTSILGADTVSRVAANLISGQTGVDGGSGAASVKTQRVILSSDSPGVGSGTSANQVQGTAADGVAAVGNPIRIAGKDASGNVQDILVGADGKIAIQALVDGDINLTATDEITINGKNAGTPVALKVDAQGEAQVDVLTLPALIAGAARIGKVTIRNAADAADIDPVSEATGASIKTAVELTDDIVHATNAALSKAAAIAGQLDDTTTTAATEDGVAAVRITSQRALHANLRNVAGTEVGTAGAPVRTDPTGTTTQPVSDASGSLTVDAPVATPVAVRITNDAVGFANAATDRATAAAPFSNRLSDGTAFYDAAKTGQLPAALVSGRLDVNVGAALPAGTANIGDVDVVSQVAASNRRSTSQALAASSNVAMSVEGCGTAGFQVVVGTGDGTMTFEYTVNGTTWSSLDVTPANGGTKVSTTTADGRWTATVAGFNQVRITRGAGNANAVTVSLEATPGGGGGGGGGAAATEFAEDAPHTTGDKGVQALAVRKDTAVALSGLDGDYTPLITDGLGRLHTQDGTSHADNAAMVRVAAIGARFDNTTPANATEDTIAALRMTEQRALHTCIRNATSDAGAVVTGSTPTGTDNGLVTRPLHPATAGLSTDGIAVPAGNAQSVGAIGLNYNGTSLDRRRGVHEVTGIMSTLYNAAATTNGSDVTNYNAKGIIILFDVTAFTTDATVTTINVQIKGSGSLGYLTIYSFTVGAIAGTGPKAFCIFPGTASAAAWTAAPLQGPIPRTFRAQVVTTGTPNYTATTYVQFIN